MIDSSIRGQFLSAFALGCSLLSFAASAQPLVCVTEMIAGIVFDRASGRWGPGTGKSGAKYVVRESKDSRLKYEILETGSTMVIGFCKEAAKNGWISCGAFGGEFFFSVTDMRFLRTYTVGYWNEKSLRSLNPNRQEGADTPSVEAGTCAAL